MRAAERRERAAAAKRAAPPAWRSPTVLVTIGAIVVALVVIAALNLRPAGDGSASAAPGGSTAVSSGRPSSGGTAALGLQAPAIPIPAGIPRDGRTLGSPTAPVTLEVWGDFQCPGCGSFSRTIEPTIVDRYVQPGQVRLTFRDYAFLGPESLDAAAAARCAGEQGKFWDYHDWLYANQNGENQGAFSRDRLAGIADAVGLDRAAWEACFDGGAEKAAVTAETTAGTAAGVRSTPTLVLNGTIVQLATFTSWDDLFKAIDAAIAAAGTPSSAAPSSAGPVAPSGTAPSGSPSLAP